jgi:chromate transport protein ChrA
MAEPALDKPGLQRTPPGFIIASVLSWVWGVLLALLAMIMFTLGFHLPSAERSDGDLLLLVAMAVVYCYLGYGLRKGRDAAIRVALVTTSVISLVTILGLVVGRRLPPLVGLAVNLALLGFVLWGQRLRKGSRAEQVGA